MDQLLQRVRKLVGMFASMLSVRRDSGPIDTVAAVQRFVSSRSAFIGQKKLYGYLKTRMGTSYPSMFEDDVYVGSIRIANHHVFAACVADLTIFAVAHALRNAPVADEERAGLAREIHAACLADNAGNAPPEFSSRDYSKSFDELLETTDWQLGALQPENFTQSPQALVRWAPIAPELKQYDTEIVENSIRFAWRDIREQYLKRLNAQAVFEDRRSSS